MNDIIQREARPPTSELRRATPFALRAAEDGEDGDGLTLDGYAAVFNRETIIDSWEGRFKERIAPGAMKKSFRENPPRVQFDHGHHPLIGSIPIGSIESVREEVDATLAPEGGAHVIARMHDNWLTQPVRDAIASGSVDGMSFRFSVVREEWHDHAGKKVTDEDDLRTQLRRTWMEEVPDEELLVRTLKELRVPELGPVVWPAYTDTSVGVRSQSVVIDLSRLGDPEERNKLAQAVLMADRADGEEPPLTEEAEEHSEPSNDTPQITAREAAEKHESASKRHELLAFLESARANNIHAESQKERYSS
jgi:HK97 family phage prohead protease